MNSIFNPNTHLINLARTGYRLPAALDKYSAVIDKIYPVAALVMAMIIVFVAQLTGSIVYYVLLKLLSSARGGTLTFEDLVSPANPLDAALYLITAFGPIFILIWLWMIIFEKRRPFTVGLEWPGAITKYLRGALVGLVMFALAVGISAALGYTAFENGDPQSQGVAALGGVFIILLGWMVQGAGEEILTRGWLLQVIGSRYNPAAGIVMSSLLFAIFHLLNPNVSYIAMLNLTLFGVFAAFYALREGGLWGVFSLHAVWNWAQGNLFGFEVSGTTMGNSTLFNLMETGPDAITGGPFGPEGGLAVTAVLVAGILLIWLAPLVKKQIKPVAA